MPNNYSGQAGNVTAGGSVSITSSTNASPIVVQTSAAHGRVAGDTVDIYGHQTNTAANGQWIVDVPDATHLSLRSSTGNGVGGATGTVDFLAFGAAFQQPSDGDAANAASVDTPFQAEADREVALLVSTGVYKLADLKHVVRNLSGLNTSYGSVSTTTAFTDVISTMGAEFTMANAQVGDILELDFDISVAGGTTTQIYGLSLYRSNVVPGAGTSFVRISGAGKTWKQTAPGTIPVHLKGWFSIGTTGTCQVAIFGQSNLAGADTITFYDDETIVAKLWRPTLLSTQ